MVQTWPTRVARKSVGLDVWLVLATVFLIACGLMSLYSIVAVRESNVFFRKQLVNLGRGAVPFALFLFVPPRFWSKISNWLYAANIGLLALVLVKGVTKLGARRWLMLGGIEFQPSEMGKLLLVLTLASFFARRENKVKDFSTFALSLLHLLPPMLLVFRQPHLGATIVLVVIWFCISLAADVPLKYIAATALVLCVGAGVIVKVKPSLLLKEYQQGRLDGMGSGDKKGAAFHTHRAEIAFGSGGLLGAGYLKGEFKEKDFIPEQENDFIFTVVGQEGGLAGASLVLAGFGFFFFRIWLAMLNASEGYHRMICGGILGMLGFHMIVNLCMNLQIVPVVGLWLPFLSYGGTALWLCLASVGLVLNIRSRQLPVLFD